MLGVPVADEPLRLRAGGMEPEVKPTHAEPGTVLYTEPEPPPEFWDNQAELDKTFHGE